MKTISDRTPRAEWLPTWYIVFFFLSSHHAGTSSQAVVGKSYLTGARRFSSGSRNWNRNDADADASIVPRTWLNGIGKVGLSACAADRSSNSPCRSSEALPRPMTVRPATELAWQSRQSL